LLEPRLVILPLGQDFSGDQPLEIARQRDAGELVALLEDYMPENSAME
jgi:hypothetical protein